jgi:predicted secreted Zn-dependent protease
MILGAGAAAGQPVRERVEVRYYSVAGTTALELMSRMAASELSGRLGPGAAAGIVPSYQLDVVTEARPDGCYVKDVNLDLSYVITLPVARDEALMTSQTRDDWREFFAFTRAHEEGHRRIYMTCAQEFVASAMQLASNRSCASLERQADRLLLASRQVCEVLHNQHDASDGLAVRNLSLVRESYGLR